MTEFAADANIVSKAAGKYADGLAVAGFISVLNPAVLSPRRVFLYAPRPMMCYILPGSLLMSDMHKPKKRPPVRVVFSLVVLTGLELVTPSM